MPPAAGAVGSETWGRGTMLVGMALFKLGIFSGTRSRRFYALMVLVGYGISVPLNALET